MNPRMLFLTTTLLFTALAALQAQVIKAPEGFKLQKADRSNQTVDHYVKDGYDFMVDEWMGAEPKNKMKFDPEIAKFLSENYRTSLTTDLHFSGGVYYGVAHFSNKYFFIVLCNDNVYKLSSTVIDPGFEKYSNWLLSEAKRIIK